MRVAAFLNGSSTQTRIVIQLMIFIVLDSWYNTHQQDAAEQKEWFEHYHFWHH